MEKIALITDSGCDLTKEQLKKYNVNLLPFRVIYKDKEFADKLEISAEYVYENLHKEIPTTSLPSIQDMEDTINNLIKDGYTHLIAITISSNLSGTYNSLRLVCENHPEIKSYIFDTKILSIPQGIIVKECSNMIQENKSFQEIIDTLPSFRKNIAAYYTLDTLEYLKKGGRIGKVTATIGDVLNIKPIITVTDDGIYKTHSKTRGKKQSVTKMKHILEDNYLENGKYNVWILEGGAKKEAEQFLNSVKNNTNIISISIATIGPALGVHTGTGLIGFAVQKAY